MSGVDWGAMAAAAHAVATDTAPQQQHAAAAAKDQAKGQGKSKAAKEKAKEKDAAAAKAETISLAASRAMAAEWAAVAVAAANREAEAKYPVIGRVTPGLVSGGADTIVKSVWLERGHAFDDNQLLLDVQFLATPPLKGREPDTPGSSAAGLHITKRMHSAGLLAFAPQHVARPIKADPFARKNRPAPDPVKFNAEQDRWMAQQAAAAAADAAKHLRVKHPDTHVRANPKCVYAAPPEDDGTDGAAAASAAAADAKDMKADGKGNGADAKAKTTAGADASEAPDYRRQFWDPVREQRLTNYCGYHRGTDPTSKLAICITAHYDHLGEFHKDIYPGADDNASGVGAVLALADHFHVHPPQHTLIFVCFDGEETGYRGAKDFVAHCPWPIADVALNVNMDMLAHQWDNRLRMCGLDAEHYPFLTPYCVRAAQGKTTVNLVSHNYKTEGHTIMLSDHREFHAAGIPFLKFGVHVHRCYHEPSDTFARINHGFYQRAVHAIADIVIECDRSLDAIRADHTNHKAKVKAAGPAAAAADKPPAVVAAEAAAAAAKK